MRAVLGLLIAGAALCPACVCSSAVDLDRALLEGDDAGVDPDDPPDSGHDPPGHDAGPAGDAGLEPCPQGWTRCSGTCVDTDADDQSCGACGIACADGWICVAGACAPLCVGDHEVLWCLDQCIDPDRDKHNCGACGVVCVEHQDCNGGTCR